MQDTAVPTTEIFYCSKCQVEQIAREHGICTWCFMELTKEERAAHQAKMDSLYPEPKPKAKRKTRSNNFRPLARMSKEERETLRKEAAVITPEEQVQIDLLQQEFTLDDFGNSDRFLYYHSGEFLHTKSTGWLVYGKDGLWREDNTALADQAMRETILLIEEEAALVADKKKKNAILTHAHASRSNNKRKAALECAAVMEEFSRDFDDFDNHDELFHFANGELNLETFEFLPHDPSLLLTKGSSIKYDPAATCQGFERYIREVTDNNDNLIRYLQRCAGYTLTAVTGEAAMFIPTGIGGTGKTTFLTILHGILGSYAMRAERNSLMLRRGDEGQAFDYHGMKGCRALIASETEEGKSIAVSKVKELTGNEKKLRACKKFHDSYEFKPKAKVWLACNDFPRAPAGDESLWDRLKPVPFNRKFRGTDGEVKDLAEKLLVEEASGILNWMIRGLEEYWEIGLAVPEEAKAKAQELREEQDFLGRFLDERMEKTENPAEMVLVSKLYETFQRHAETTGEGKYWTRQKFNSEMRAKGYEDRKVAIHGTRETRRVWFGVRLSSSYTAESFAMADVEVL